jgi:phage tail tube protein FII
MDGGRLSADSLRQFGTASINGVMLRLQQALWQDDTGEVTPVSIVMRTGTARSTSARPRPATPPRSSTPPS